MYFCRTHDPHVPNDEPLCINETRVDEVDMLNRVVMDHLYLLFTCFVIILSFRVLLLMTSINIRELRRYCTLKLKLWLHFELSYLKHL
jgi:hypothetical protein